MFVQSGFCFVYLPTMAKILITGGTGLIGQQLTQQLQDKGYEVAILSRNPTKENQYKWDINKGFIDENALTNTDYIIHLTGAGIADKYWTPARKKVIINSRVQSANLLFEKVKKLHIPLKGFISASGIGYYGAVTSDTIFSEEDNSGNDFLADVCVQWENATHQFSRLGIRTTILRTGIVLAKKGGALQKMNTPLFLSALGNGKQYMPWIHIDDICNLYVKAIEDTNFTGSYNAVAPEHQTNDSFTKILGITIKKPVSPINVPSFMMKLIFGKMAVLLLKGSRISSKKVENLYSYKFSTLQNALTAIFN